jgi:hypothetical protein
MRRRVTRIHIASLIISGLFLSFASLTGQRAVACDCARAGSPREELRRTDAVFSGEVTSINRERIEFKVESFWKGPRSKRISIRYEQSDCTYLFTVGKKYLVYAYGKEIFETSICAGAKELDKASDDLKELGEGKEP